MTRYLLGVSGYSHESAVALINSEGKLVDYCREEYLSRIKSDKSFPKRSIKKLLSQNNIEYCDIESVCFYEKPLTAYINPIKTAISNLPKSLDLCIHQLKNFRKSSINFFSDLSDIDKSLGKKVIYCDHHLSHTLTSLFYKENKEYCSIVIDGFGDHSTSTIHLVQGIDNISEIWSSQYPASLGLFYSAITDFLGFAVNEGEYKVMGLSAFGEPKFIDKFRSIISFEEGRVEMDMDYFSYHLSLTDSYSSKLSNALNINPRNSLVRLETSNSDFQVYADIAASAQLVLLEIITKIFKYAYSLTSSSDFLFSGGVAMNSASIRSILQENSFINSLYIPPSPGDAGAAIGAAYYALIRSNPKPSIFTSSKSINLFPCRNEELLSPNTLSLMDKEFEVIADSDNIFPICAELIATGNIIATCLPGVETGPRALGHRSLLCDGTNHSAVKYLNEVIKKRSPFRPTAPAMTVETARKYYNIDNRILSLYYSMGATCSCKEGAPSISFPTTHCDGTARLQIVEEGSFLDTLLGYLNKHDKFILANTSLNLSSDPIAYDLIDAIMVALRSNLSYVLTEKKLFKKRG